MPPIEQPDWVLTRRQAIGEAIRTARRAAVLTQEQVGLRTGIERHDINRIEQGYVSPCLDSLLLIADAIGVPLADLVR